MSSTGTSLDYPPCAMERGQFNRRELWRRYPKCGPGSAVENSLIEQYLPLVKTVAGRLAMTLPSHISVEDLYSAGLVGLLHGVRRFDPAGGSSFEAYARIRIRGAILDELRRLDWVPRSVRDKARKVEQTRRNLAHRNGAMPSDEEMAAALDLSPREYEELVKTIRPATYVCLDSLQTGDGEHDGGCHELINDESQMNPGEDASLREMASLMEERLQQLPEIQRKVLRLYYFEDLRLREIAEVYGVTESRICQIHAQAILAIKAFLRRRDPDVFNHPLRVGS
jgi:RNA polymerase sigma factor FliA